MGKMQPEILKDCTPKDKKQYRCDHCGKTFPFVSILKRHFEKTHTSKSPAKVQSVPNSPQKVVENSKSRRKQSLIARKLF